MIFNLLEVGIKILIGTCYGNCYDVIMTHQQEKFLIHNFLKTIIHTW